MLRKHHFVAQMQRSPDAEVEMQLFSGTFDTEEATSPLLEKLKECCSLQHVRALLPQPSVCLSRSYGGSYIVLPCGRMQSMPRFSVQLLVPVWRFITSVEQADGFTVLVTKPRNCVYLWDRSYAEYSTQQSNKHEKRGYLSLQEPLSLA